jgi:hypothetical protein
MASSPFQIEAKATIRLFMGSGGFYRDFNLNGALRLKYLTFMDIRYVQKSIEALLPASGVRVKHSSWPRSTIFFYIPYFRGGDPSRPLFRDWDSSWLTGDVVALGMAMAPGPILADALEDAGCNNQIVLCDLRAEYPGKPTKWLLDKIWKKDPTDKTLEKLDWGRK